VEDGGGGGVADALAEGGTGGVGVIAGEGGGMLAFM